MKKKSNPILPLFLIAFTTVFVGIVVGSYCGFFSYLDTLAKDRLISHPTLYIFITPALFWVAAYLCRKFSPNSSGNVLEYIKKSLEETKKHPEDQKKIRKFLSFRIAIVSFISSLICSFAGGALGREGPSVHMSSSIFADVACRMKNKVAKINVQNWIFAGSAVGIAVAFNAPIAGLIYVLEKLFKNKYYDFKTNSSWTLFTMIVFVICLQHPEPVFLVSGINFAFDSEQIFLIILVAAVCGFLAFFFKKINIYFYNKFTSIKSNLWHLVPIIAGLLVALISLYCGIYSFSGGIKTANDALASTEIILSYKEVIGRILNTIITFSSGAAGGLIAPSVTIGAGVASVIGSFADVIDIRILMLVGMASFLAVILGEPITAAILIYESANQSVSSLPFLIFASLISISMVKLFKGFEVVQPPHSL